MVDPKRTIEAIWRIESAHLIAALSRLLNDVGRAEEISQDTFVTALETWLEEGVPPNPGAWLMTAAKHKAIDFIRREKVREVKYALLDERQERDDDLLSLIFIACHPVLSQESRAALTLRLVCGLTTEEIARAYLSPAATLGQRLSRAKRTLAEARVPFEVPREGELRVRLAAVLEVVYLVFNEGYAATSGEIWIRRDLAEEAMRLGRMLAGLLPREPEVHGLVALMELQASRFPARYSPQGEPVLLPDQDRSRWDKTLITHGLAALDRSIALQRPLGPYAVQAAIAACHTRASSYAMTDWDAVLALYDALLALTPSPVVALNRTVAVMEAVGAAAALEAIDGLRNDPHMARYHLYGAVRGEILQRLDQYEAAAEWLENAASLAPTQRERRTFLERAAAASEKASARQ